MAELEVIDKGVRLVHGDISIGLEEHHGYRSTRLHVSDNVFRKNIQAEMNVSRSINNSNWDGPEYGDQKSNNQSPPGQMSWPGADRCDTHSSHSEEQQAVPPPRHGFVLSHHLCMVVIEGPANGTGVDRDLLAMEKDGVKNHGSYPSERETV